MTSGVSWKVGVWAALWRSLTRTDSFAIYDVEARGVIAFSNLNPSVSESCGRYDGDAVLTGLFAASCGPLIAQYAPVSGREYRYDLSSLDGTPIALGLHSPERVVGVEGPLFYSVRTLEDGTNELRVWKMSFEAG